MCIKITKQTIMKTQITIPEPCNEDWNKMTPTEKGAFCSSCSKEVKDFTNSSDLEILKTIESSESQICGHITNTQLDRPLDTTQSNLRRWIIPFAASFTALTVSCDMNAQNESFKVGKMMVNTPIKNGNIKVTQFKPVDTIIAPICKTTKGDMKIETIKETQLMVDGMMIIQPIPEIKKEDTVIKEEIIQQKEDTIYLDSIPFKAQTTEDSSKNTSSFPKAIVFPNPVSDWTTIQVKEEGLYNVSISNNSGSVILKKSFFGKSLKVNISNQPTGIYFITLINGAGLKSKSLKLIKN